ncbi:MAG: LysE family translocator [Rhodobacteraceae bacterium]|nr:LysE family translocator [Paracoccaceae bacterium]
MPPDIFTTLIAISTINMLAWLTPGPNMLVIISAATQSRKAGYVTALGVGFGGVIWGLLAVSGIAIVFELFPKAALALRLFGAGYLIWLGYKAWQSTAPAATLPRVTPAPFKTGLMVMMTNPKAVLYFGSILTAFVPAHAPLWLLVLIVMLGSLQATIQNLITARLFSAPPVQRWFNAAHRALQRLFGTLYIVLGLGVAVDAYKRL